METCAHSPWAARSAFASCPTSRPCARSATQTWNVMHGWWFCCRPARQEISLRFCTDEIARAVALPEVEARLVALGFEPATATADEVAALIKSELPKWAGVIQTAGIKPN